MCLRFSETYAKKMILTKKKDITRDKTKFELENI